MSLFSLFAVSYQGFLQNSFCMIYIIVANPNGHFTLDYDIYINFLMNSSYASDQINFISILMN